MFHKYSQVFLGTVFMKHATFPMPNGWILSKGSFSPLLLWQTSNWVPTDRISACLFHLRFGLTFLKEVASSGNPQLLDPYELWDTVWYIWLLNDPYLYHSLLFVFRNTLDFLWASLVAQLVKNPSAMQETGFDP